MWLTNKNTKFVVYFLQPVIFETAKNSSPCQKINLLVASRMIKFYNLCSQEIVPTMETFCRVSVDLERMSSITLQAVLDKALTLEINLVTPKLVTESLSRVKFHRAPKKVTRPLVATGFSRKETPERISQREPPVFLQNNEAQITKTLFYPKFQGKRSGCALYAKYFQQLYETMKNFTKLQHTTRRYSNTIVRILEK